MLDVPALVANLRKKYFGALATAAHHEVDSNEYWYHRGRATGMVQGITMALNMVDEDLTNYIGGERAELS